MTRLTAYVCGLVAIDLALFSAIVPLLPQTSDRLDLSKVESGVLLGSFSLAVVVASVPVGHLADRAGMRAVTVAGSLLTAVATAMFALGVAIISQVRTSGLSFEAALFGNILGITEGDLAVIGIVTAEDAIKRLVQVGRF